MSDLGSPCGSVKKTLWQSALAHIWKGRKINSWKQHIDCTSIHLDCLIFLQTKTHVIRVIWKVIELHSNSALPVWDVLLILNLKSTKSGVITGLAVWSPAPPVHMLKTLNPKLLPIFRPPLVLLLVISWLTLIVSEKLTELNHETCCYEEGIAERSCSSVLYFDIENGIKRTIHLGVQTLFVLFGLWLCWHAAQLSFWSLVEGDVFFFLFINPEPSIVPCNSQNHTEFWNQIWLCPDKQECYEIDKNRHMYMCWMVINCESGLEVKAWIKLLKKCRAWQLVTKPLTSCF